MVYYYIMKLKKLDKKVFFVYGGTTTETREKIRKIVEKEKETLLSLQVMVLFLLVLILGTSTMSCSHLLPRVRRLPINRKRGLSQRWRTKTSVKLFDVSDNITYKSRQNFTYRHFNERLNIYKQENFNYEINRGKSMNYQVVKLSNGEDIICNVERTIDGSITNIFTTKNGNL